MHQSWKPIENLRYQEPLKSLNYKILNAEKFEPRKDLIFKVFEMPLQRIRVVVLGQNPYYTPNTAVGRAFAVNKEAKIPPSLRIIAKEMKVDPKIGSWRTLEHLEQQGFFLLNTALTVRRGEPASHIKYWTYFILSVIKYISKMNPCIWLLWGNKAKSYKEHIYNPQIIKDEMILKPNHNYILESTHPAAEVYGKGNFIGSGHFKKVNEILKNKKEKQINYEI